jgi:tetratricopeptide (TPR) repeat protein
MKKTLLFFILYAHFASAINGQETFLQANKQYQNKNYEKALTLYATIEKKGGAIWYNMGNCHYQLGHEADALVCWKRAQRSASNSLQKEIAYNIDVVMNEQSESHEATAFAKLMMLLQHVSTLFAQIIFLLLLIALFLAIRLSKHSKKYKVASFVLCAFMLPVAALVGFKYAHHQESIAIALTDAKLFAGPNEKYHVVATIAAKNQLRVHAKNGNWYKVAHYKQMGWVNSDDVVVL